MVTDFSVDDYVVSLVSLIDIDRARALDAGSESISVPAELLELNLAEALSGQTVTDRDMATCCLSGIWLLYDQLDRSHDFSQQIKTSAGSFWHGIMHRREGDFSNAKYWFRSVGDHPLYESLAEEARRIAALHAPTQPRPTQHGPEDQIDPFAADGWDPFAFVDACEAAVRRGESSEPLLVAIQQREWELLFDFCYRRAIGQ